MAQDRTVEAILVVFGAPDATSVTLLGHNSAARGTTEHALNFVCASIPTAGMWGAAYKDREIAVSSQEHAALKAAGARGYRIDVTFRGEETGFVARVPALGSIAAGGDSRQKALVAAREAITVAIKAREALGHPIPESEL